MVPVRGTAYSRTPPLTPLRCTVAGERFVGRLTQNVAQVGDRGGELGECRRGEGTECETGDGGCRFEASEAVEEYRESCQGGTDNADVA